MKDSPRGNSSIVTTPRVFVQFSLFLSTQPRKLSKEIAKYFISYVFARYACTCVCVPVFFLARLKKCRLPDTIVHRPSSSCVLSFPFAVKNRKPALIRRQLVHAARPDPPYVPVPSEARELRYTILKRTKREGKKESDRTWQVVR